MKKTRSRKSRDTVPLIDCYINDVIIKKTLTALKLAIPSMTFPNVQRRDSAMSFINATIFVYFGSFYSISEDNQYIYV
jgi:hypothetical protein